MDDKEIYQEVLEEYGQLQIVVCMEEMAELTKELSKAMRGKADQEHIAEEIADVQIMLAQMIMHFKVERAVKRWRNLKLERLWRKLREIHEGEK